MSDTQTARMTMPRAIAQIAAPHVSQAMTVFVMIMAILYFGKDVLMPITLALLLAFVLTPLVNLLRRAHLGRVPSVLVGVTLALCIVLAIGGVIASQVAQLTPQIPSYATAVETKISSVRDYTVGRLSRLADEIGSPTEKSQAPKSESTSSRAAPEAAPPGALHVFGQTPLALAERYLSPVLSPFATFGIVFIVAVFALLQKEDLHDRLILLIGADDLHRTTLAIDDGARRLNRYFLTQLIINTAFGTVVGIGLLIIGLPYPVLWGIVSALLRFVPYVGSLISAVLPITLAAAVEPGWSMMAWTAGLYLVIETVTGQVLEPLVYGNSTGISPFAVVVAAIFWSWLWGPVGLILSTPLTLCLVVIGRHVKHLEFLDVLLGDRQTVLLTEAVYQSILDGDADEAMDHAELMLKERSLATYYDEVVVKAMQLAARDAGRGIIDREQLERVSSTIRSLVRGLNTYKDEKASPNESEAGPPTHALDRMDSPSEPHPLNQTAAGVALPPAWTEKSPRVLCIAGRSLLDETTSIILAQLLDKHGLDARPVKNSDVSREKIETLDVANVAIVCISFLGIDGSVGAHLHYLVQRLRTRLPAVKIIVGIWQWADPVQHDDAARTAIGADALAGSLQETVTLCEQTAIEIANSEARARAVQRLG